MPPDDAKRVGDEHHPEARPGRHFSSRRPSSRPGPNPRPDERPIADAADRVFDRRLRSDREDGSGSEPGENRAAARQPRPAQRTGDGGAPGPCLRSKTAGPAGVASDRVVPDATDLRMKTRRPAKTRLLAESRFLGTTGPPAAFRLLVKTCLRTKTWSRSKTRSVRVHAEKVDPARSMRPATDTVPGFASKTRSDPIALPPRATRRHDERVPRATLPTPADRSWRRYRPDDRFEPHVSLWRVNRQSDIAGRTCPRRVHVVA